MKKYAQYTLLFVMFMVTSIGVLAAQADAREWTLDKAHSNIYFSIDHIFSKVNGHFNDFSTKMVFDPKDLSNSTFYFEIETASVDTNIGKRDKHLQSSDFFASGKYPLITFSSVTISDAGNNNYNVSGKLTVKGQTYDMVLPLSFAGMKPHPAVKKKDVIGFNGNLVLDRLAYQVGNGKFHKMGVVGQNVDVFISIELLSGN